MGSVTTKKHANGLEYVDVDTSLCKARIFLQGAQIDFFNPRVKSRYFGCLMPMTTNQEVVFVVVFLCAGRGLV